MRRFLRYIYRNIIPARIGQFLDLFPYLRALEVHGFEEKRVLVLSPHPDDDIIGCGGTLYRYHLKGAEITVVYITDGRKGNNRYREDELASIRREEAKRAAGIIGVDKLIFLDNRDSELTHTPKSIREVSEILGDIRPEAVFLPFFTDNHPDHVATSHIFFLASKTFASVMCYLYGVWTPLPTHNISSDITPYAEAKILALQEHKSQLELIDLIGAVQGLSRYYAALDGKNGYAELFLACPLREYRRLGEVIQW